MRKKLRVALRSFSLSFFLGCLFQIQLINVGRWGCFVFRSSQQDRVSVPVPNALCLSTHSGLKFGSLKVNFDESMIWRFPTMGVPHSWMVYKGTSFLEFLVFPLFMKIWPVKAENSVEFWIVVRISVLNFAAAGFTFVMIPSMHGKTASLFGGCFFPFLEYVGSILWHKG